MNKGFSIVLRCVVAAVAAGAAGVAPADEMTLENGETVKGEFGGYKNHRFVFTTAEGAERQEFAAGVKKIGVDKPLPVTAQTINGPLNDVLFKQYERYNVVLLKDGREFNQPATLLKQMDLASQPAPAVVPIVAPAVPEPPAPGRETGVTTPAAKPPVQERQLSGDPRWRMKQASLAKVISQGESVDVDAAVERGAVNIVHFHFSESLASTREGNYVEALARKRTGRVVVLRVVVPDWNAPVCKDLDLKSLPQFWFYGSSGKLVRKLTDRFTESDIDAALAEARRGG